MNLVLDTGILGQLCNPKSNPDLARWISEFAVRRAKTARICIPEIVDYECRRGLLYLLKKAPPAQSAAYQARIDRLDRYCQAADFIELSTPVLRSAAGMWADARLQGQSTAPEPALDGDVILAAQARGIGGTIRLMTTNKKHLVRYLGSDAVFTWQDVRAGLVSIP